MMHAEVLTKIQAEVAEWEYLQSLPVAKGGFTLKKTLQEVEDRYEIFSYGDEEKHLELAAFYHEETNEYKVRLAYGLMKFVRTEFISRNLPDFTERITEHFDATLREMTEGSSVSPLLAQKELNKWDYPLPESAEGFALFCRPDKPFALANDSYLIFEYADFKANSGFDLFYNILRDEFFGESRIRGLSVVTYDFDARDLAHLSEKLNLHLTKYLQDIRNQTISVTVHS